MTGAPDPQTRRHRPADVEPPAAARAVTARAGPPQWPSAPARPARVRHRSGGGARDRGRWRGGALVVGAAGNGGHLARAATPTVRRARPQPPRRQVTRQTLVDTRDQDGELGYGTARDRGQPAERHGHLAAGRGARRSAGKGALPGRQRAGGAAVRRPARVPGAASGVEGTDVKQFEQNLAALGYTGFTVDDEYTRRPPTRSGTGRSDLGLTETGPVEPGRIVYAAGEVRVDSHGAEVGDTVAAGPGGAHVHRHDPGGHRASWTSTTSGWPARARRSTVTLPGRHAGAPARITDGRDGDRRRRRRPASRPRPRRSR